MADLNDQWVVDMREDIKMENLESLKKVLEDQKQRLSRVEHSLAWEISMLTMYAKKVVQFEEEKRDSEFLINNLKMQIEELEKELALTDKG